MKTKQLAPHPTWGKRFARTKLGAGRALALIFFLLTATASYAGRIAISEDGNYHDHDDYFASAMHLALASALGRAGDLVYFGYDDHTWRTNFSMETQMATSVNGGASRFGPFANATFVNARQSRARAIAALTAEINASTSTDRLTILASGPMQVIGWSLAGSKWSVRRYVTIISHSLWNNVHATKNGPGEGLAAPRYSFDSLGKMGAHLLPIPDQNPGLARYYAEYHWLRDSTNPDLRWLYTRALATGKTLADCSDAGMMVYLLTGDAQATPAQLKAILDP